MPLTVAAADIYKNATNPGGIPDLTQTDVPGVPAKFDSAICLAAAAGDALWHFDQLSVGGVRKYPGLVTHSDKDVPADPRKDWGVDGYQLVKTLADRIYADNQGGWGIHRYIYAQRGAKDVSTETATYRRGNTEVKKEVKVWNWNTEVYTGAKVTNDLIKKAVETTTQVGILGANWHEQGKPAGEFMQANGQNIGHHLVIAGRDDQEKHLVLAHGWGDHWLDAANKTTPVRSSYYDNYDYKVEDGRLRITDPNLITRAGGLEGRTPDYAEIENVRMLDSEGKMRFSVDAFKQAFPAAGLAAGDPAGALTHFEFLTFNGTADHVNRLALELPLSDAGAFSAGDISGVILPTGWHYRLWNPNIDVASPELPTDQGIANWLGYQFRGLIFESDADYVSPGTGLDIGFDIAMDLLVPGAEMAPLDAAAWNATGDIAYVGLAVPVDEPPAWPLTLLGAIFLAGSRGRRSGAATATRTERMAENRTNA